MSKFMFDKRDMPVKVYQTSDGKTFSTYQQAQKHNSDLRLINDIKQLSQYEGFNEDVVKFLIENRFVIKLAFSGELSKRPAKGKEKEIVHV